MIDTRCVVMYDKNTVLIPEGEAVFLKQQNKQNHRSALQIVDDRITIDSA